MLQKFGPSIVSICNEKPGLNGENGRPHVLSSMFKNLSRYFKRQQLLFSMNFRLNGKIFFKYFKQRITYFFPIEKFHALLFQPLTAEALDFFDNPLCLSSICFQTHSSSHVRRRNNSRHCHSNRRFASQKKTSTNTIDTRGTTANGTYGPWSKCSLALQFAAQWILTRKEWCTTHQKYMVLEQRK